MGTRQGLVAVDVGNTTTSVGVFEGDELVGSCELTTPAQLTADEARLQVRQVLDMLSHPLPDAAILACVVPALAAAWAQALEACCGARALVVGPGLKSGLRMRVDDPAEVGADRVADAVAARALFGAPCVVVDLGTTTNIEAIDADGAFAGGLIAPGIDLGARSLAAATARLPQVELRRPARVIGTNTREAIQAGVVLGEAARIDGLLSAVLAELGCEARVVVTGRLASQMAGLIGHDATVEPHLTLRGLQLIFARNDRTRR